MPKVCVVVGPTAVGKTACAIELCKRFNGEVVSGDSMQLYKYMNIGTAKPTADELSAAKHHMIDICEPTYDFSCAEYCERASKITDDIIRRGKLPVICGGTGLYIDTLISGYEQSPAEPNEKLRGKLEKKTSDELYDELCRIDPQTAANVHKNNRIRVIRAIEIYRSTGINKTEWDMRSKPKEPRYDAIYIGLECKDRELLYSRINNRVDAMILNGLESEVRNLPKPLSKTASQAIGYKEMLSYIDGDISFEKACELIKQGSRNYAKRQLTWFKRNTHIKWFYTDKGLDSETVYEYVKSKL